MRRRGFMQGLGVTGALLYAPAVVLATPDVAAVTFWLLLDASGSMYNMTTNHWVPQRNGHIKALEDPEVQQLLMIQPTRVHVAAWAGRQAFLELTPPGGILVQSTTDAEMLASLIREHTPIHTMSDSSTHHLDACLAVLDRYNKDPQGKLIIDISTDAGVEPEDWRAMALARQNVLDVGGTINVFAVDVNPAEDGFRTLDELVRTGFLMQGTFEEYHQGMLQKMLKELMM